MNCKRNGIRGFQKQGRVTEKFSAALLIGISVVRAADTVSGPLVAALAEPMNNFFLFRHLWFSFSFSASGDGMPAGVRAY